MCGISGFIGKKIIEEERVRLTLDLMSNRGPDYQDYSIINDKENITLLLHSRLSIIDLDERANQPFTIDDCSIVFNGEIYNYLELRQELKKKGISFRTESDTEVLLQSYIVFGEGCVNLLEGMWAFAIYDRKKRKLFLSRDRFAEKPLYYLEVADGIYFGSEVKFIKSLSGIKLDVNVQHLFRYLVNGYKSIYKHHDTFFKQVKEVPFATNFIIGQDLTKKFNRYWNPVFEPRRMTLSEAVSGFKYHFLESVKIRLRADVPLAFSLGGGIDSGAIVSAAKKIFNYEVMTFSIIDNDERYNEYENIRATIDDLGCKHIIINIPQDRFFTHLEKLIRYHDAPVYTISHYIHSFIMNTISRNGYKVVISGAGADELTTGYYDHFNLHLYEMRDTSDYESCLSSWETKVKHFVRNPYLKNPNLYFARPDFRKHVYLNNDIFMKYLKVDFREEFSETRYCDSLLRNRMLNELFHEVVPPILHEDDLNAMFYSIENRSPYLDSRLFKFAYSIPNECLIQDGYAKFILREAMKGVLNEKVRTDRHKRGFNASINSLLDFNQRQNRDYILEDAKIFNLVKRNEIEKLLDMRPMSNSYSKFLFYFINAKIFLESN